MKKKTDLKGKDRLTWPIDLVRSLAAECGSKMHLTNKFDGCRCHRSRRSVPVQRPLALF